MTMMSATDVSRNLSEVLNRVVAGETIEIVRNGATIANLTPHRPRTITRERFNELMRSLPPVDRAFARDVTEAGKDPLVLEDPWSSKSTPRCSSGSSGAA